MAARAEILTPTPLELDGLTSRALVGLSHHSGDARPAFAAECAFTRLGPRAVHRAGAGRVEPPDGAVERYAGLLGDSGPFNPRSNSASRWSRGAA